MRDNTGINISHKNKYYGEYTFHYWFWKNIINTIEKDTWIGFCAYRRFWIQDNFEKNIKYKKDFLSFVPEKWKEYDCIIGQDIYVNDFKLMKIIKHGMRSLIMNPKYIFKKNRNIKFHFDSFHGYGALNKAINLLDEKDREDFRNFTVTKNCYNRGNMFICRSKKIINAYYQSVFPWLERCEKIFGFDSKSYGSTRIYGFLAERYLSYWFNKYTKPLVWPIVFFDITKNKIL